jgi:hypothetical protein
MRDVRRAVLPGAGPFAFSLYDRTAIMQVCFGTGTPRSFRHADMQERELWSWVSGAAADDGSRPQRSRSRRDHLAVSVMSLQLLVRPRRFAMTMEPLWDKNGSVVGWMDKDEVLDPDGRYRAFINGNSVYAYSGGEHIGWFEQGWIWDSNNDALVFTSSATGGPARPGLRGLPGRPGIRGKPGRPGLSGVPGKPGRSFVWSHLGWTEWAPAAP